MMTELNYLRFMSREEYESYKDGSLTLCRKQWREGEIPNFYFFGIKENSLENINLLDALDNGYYYIEEALAWDVVNGTSTYDVAVLFQGDNSLEEVHDTDGWGVGWKDVLQYKIPNYLHLKELEARPCFLTYENGQEVGLGQPLKI